MWVIFIFFVCISSALSEKCDDPNSHFSDCGSLCEPTCKDRNPICPRMCVPECVCDKGYIIDDDTKQCIQEEKCPQKETCDDPNSHFSDCGSLCEPTCKDRNPICPKMCVPECVCDKGYIIDDDTKQCIEEEKCPQKEKCDAPHSHFSKCGSPCEPTCKDRTPTCPTVCVEECVCDKGFIIDDKTGQCIEEKQCPSQTGK